MKMEINVNKNMQFRGVVNLKNNKFLGIELNKAHHQMDNRLVWSPNGENILFKSTPEETFDLMLYVTLVYHVSVMGVVESTIPRLAKKMGYKPRNGKGNINDKIKKSIERLADNMFIEYYIDEKIYCIKLNVRTSEKQFFRLHYYTIDKILGIGFIDDLDAEIIEGNTKYTDRAKALYVYCYLCARMSYQTRMKYNFNGDADDGEEMKFAISYPSYEEICEDCSISKSTLIKLIRYFELDNLLFTANIGLLKMDNEKAMANNYYVLNYEDLAEANQFALKFYKGNGYDVTDRNVQKVYLADKISKVIKKGADELALRDAEHKGEKGYVPYRPLYLDRVDAQFDRLFTKLGITEDMYKAYIVSKKYMDSPYKAKIKHKKVLFLLSRVETNVEFLNHCKNCFEAINIMYKI